MTRRTLSPVPRLLLTRQEASEAMGMSLNHFERHVQPHLRLVRSGQKRLVPVRELDRWIDQQAHYVHGPDGANLQPG